MSIQVTTLLKYSAANLHETLSHEGPSVL